MDHAGDILNYIQTPEGRMYPRRGVEIHEFFVAADRVSGAALVWAKDQFAVIEVTAGNDAALERWEELAGDRATYKGPILYEGEG